MVKCAHCHYRQATKGTANMAKQTQGKATPAQAATPAPVAATQTPAPATAAVAVATPAPATAAGLPANVANVPAAPPKGGTRSSGTKGPFINPMPRSTVANPVQVAWALYASLYQQHGPALTRTQACNAAMAAGVAYYTARTQYQLWRTALLASAAQQAAAPAAPAA